MCDWCDENSKMFTNAANNYLDITMRVKQKTIYTTATAQQEDGTNEWLLMTVNINYCPYCGKKL